MCFRSFIYRRWGKLTINITTEAFSFIVSMKMNYIFFTKGSFGSYTSLVALTAFREWPSVEGHLKGVLYWGGHKLGQFSISRAPLQAVCVYLLSSFQLALWFMCSDSLFILFVIPKPHYQYITPSFSFWNMIFSTRNYYFSLKFKSWL